MTTRRPSKAEIRRRIAAQQAPEPPAPPLPDHIATYVSNYRPDGLDSETWNTIRPFVLDTLARYEPDRLTSARMRLGTLAAYAGWAHERGYPLERDVLLDCDLIEAFVDSAGVSRTTAANYRSRLNGIVGRVNPAGKGPAVSVKVAHRAVKAPYGPDEVAAIVRIARTQPSETTGRQLRACVGLGLGAGLDSVDLKPLRGRNLHDGEEGIRVEVPGRRGRTVWVLAEFEDLVRSAIDGLRPSSLVVGTKASRRNVAAKIFEQAHILGDAPHFEQSRMRTTWLARLLVARVPLPVIMQAAGLTSARTLTDLIPLLDIDTDATAGLLRGER